MTPNLEFVRRKVAFHHWAGDKTMDAIANLSAQQLDAQWGGSFGTGRALFDHILGAERIWCDRLMGKPTGKLPGFPATHSGADLRGEWHKIRDDQRKFVDQLADGSYKKPFTWTNTKGEVTTAPMSEVFEHIVNHGTYHRGQATQLLRDRGLAAPGTDYLVYMKQNPIP